MVLISTFLLAWLSVLAMVEAVTLGSSSTANDTTTTLTAGGGRRLMGSRLLPYTPLLPILFCSSACVHSILLTCIPLSFHATNPPPTHHPK